MFCSNKLNSVWKIKDYHIFEKKTYNEIEVLRCCLWMIEGRSHCNVGISNRLLLLIGSALIGALVGVLLSIVVSSMTCNFLLLIGWYLGISATVTPHLNISCNVLLVCVWLEVIYVADSWLTHLIRNNFGLQIAWVGCGACSRAHHCIMLSIVTWIRVRECCSIGTNVSCVLWSQRLPRLEILRKSCLVLL